MNFKPHSFDGTKLNIYLNMSINLIPCCQICNSRFKLNDSFTFDDNLHPYAEGWGEQVKFRLKVKDLDFFYGIEKAKVENEPKRQPK